MSLLRRLFPPWRTARPASRSSALAALLGDPGRLEAELTALRARAANGNSRGREELAALAERLTAAGSDIQEMLGCPAQESRTDLDQRLDGLREELGKVGREQFRVTTLLEGHGATLDELHEAWREHVGQEERAAAVLRLAQSELADQARFGLVKELLPVADALNASVQASRELLEAPPARPPARPGWRTWLLRAPGHDSPPPPADQGAALEAWLEGLLLVERRLLMLLEREGIRPIPTVGQRFDPRWHLATAIEHDTGAPDGTVVGEELRGYRLQDRVVRYAEVVVARGKGGVGVEEAEPHSAVRRQAWEA